MTSSPLAEVMGEDALGLSPLIRDLHLGAGARAYQGQVSVTTGRGLGRIAARLAGFPPAMENAPFRLEISTTAKTERWVRWFGKRKTLSYLSAVDGTLHERFGIITTVLIPQAQPDGSLTFTTGDASVLGLPLPRLLAPQGHVTAKEANDRYHFDITGDLPIAGRAIRYVGWLEPELP